MLTAEAAATIARACYDIARVGDKLVVTAVVDAGGGVLYVRRPREIHPLFAQLTIAKAFTSATFGLPREVIQEWQRQKPWLHVDLSRFGRYPIVPTAGSTEVWSENELVGGLALTSCGALDDQQVCDDVLVGLGYHSAGRDAQ